MTHHRRDLARIHELKNHPNSHYGLDIRFVLSLAFTYGGRNMPWPALLDHLARKLTPLAAIEAVTERLLA